MRRLLGWEGEWTPSSRAPNSSFLPWPVDLSGIELITQVEARQPRSSFASDPPRRQDEANEGRRSTVNEPLPASPELAFKR